VNHQSTNVSSGPGVEPKAAQRCPGLIKGRWEGLSLLFRTLKKENVRNGKSTDDALRDKQTVP
jgi:hypothetical protein